jgi:hypothetical protein
MRSTRPMPRVHRISAHSSCSRTGRARRATGNELFAHSQRRVAALRCIAYKASQLARTLNANGIRIAFKRVTNNLDV